MQFDAPIHDVPEVWDDEKMHVLDIDCWCLPRLDGQYVRHRGVFDDR